MGILGGLFPKLTKGMLVAYGDKVGVILVYFPFKGREWGRETVA